MAVPKPNYTQTPNRFIDEYMSKVSPHASMVYFVICRKTIGWHKDTEEISLSQIIKLTGLSKNSVLKGTEELESFNLINVNRKGTGRKSTNVYELNFESIKEVEKPMVNGSCGEPEGHDLEKNGSCHEPINPLNGSCGEPLNQKNGSCREHTKEIVLNKEYKEKDLEPVGSSPYNEIDKIFQAGSEALTGQPYYRDGKEAKQIKLLEARYIQNPEAFINLTRKYYLMLTKLEDDFWNSQAFTPSAFNSHYNRVLCFQAPAGMKKQEEQKARSEWDVLMDQFGRYDIDKLKYLLKGGTITRRDFDYIIQHRSLEVPA